LDFDFGTGGADLAMTGLHLSHYRIDSELGRGGMGVVYKAFDTQLDRAVALKVLPASALAIDDDRARFFREAKAAASISHPNVCHVYQVDEAVPLTEDGRPVEGQTEKRLFIAMEYIAGETLQDYVKKGPLRLQEAVSIAGQIAEALKEAHAKEIVHRDIKSANVMLTESGVAKVLDFGLAKTNQSTMLTRMGSTLGTVAYMSPEQARGEEVDGRSDLYSLGTVLYEMIAGRLPYTGDYEQAVLYGILNEPPEPLTSLRTGVPMQLEWIVEKLLSKEAEYRYQTAGDLLADLKSLDLSGSGHSRRSMAAVPVRNATGAVGGRARIWGLAASGVLLGVVVGWMLNSGQPTELAPVRTKSIQLSEIPRMSVRAISPTGRWILLDNGLVNAGQVWLHDAELDENLSPLAMDLRTSIEFSADEEWLLASGGESLPGISKFRISDGVRIPVLTDEGVMATWLTEESILYSSATDGSVWRADADGSNPIKIAAPDSARGHTALFALQSLPGEEFALATAQGTGDRNSIILLDLSRGTYEVILEEAGYPHYMTSGHVVFVDGGEQQGQIMVRPFDAGAGRFTGLKTPAGIGVRSWRAYSVSRNGTVGYTLTLDDVVEIHYNWLTSDGVVAEQLPVQSGSFYNHFSGLPNDFLRSGLEHASLSSDGERLAYAVVGSASGPDIYIQDPSEVQRSQLTFGGPSGWPTWSPDGRWVYYTALRNQRSVIARKASDFSGGEEIVVVGDATLREPAVSRDGDWLGFNDGAGNGWVMSLSDTTDISRLADRGTVDLAFSPDGQYVVAETSIGLMVFDTRGEGFFRIGGSGSFQWDPIWSSNGDYIYFRSPLTLFRVPVQTSPVFSNGPVETVASFSDQFLFSLHPDGRILTSGSEPVDGPVVSTVKIITNWGTRLAEIAPATSQ
jgi:serine/threonine protein kinase